MKNPLTPAGIEPAAFRFVAQHLNHCATAVPYKEFIRVSNKTVKLREACFRGRTSNGWLRSTSNLLSVKNCLPEVKGKAVPLQAWIVPEGFQEVETPRFQDIRHMKVVRLSALRTGRL